MLNALGMTQQHNEYTEIIVFINYQGSNSTKWYQLSSYNRIYIKELLKNLNDFYF